ncbi:hypothetical protein E8D34_07765, partial [Nocardioides sp. GY 10113]|uniref:hypothetical protein n=1 Tax=Nocardioides sp. GY 10113 TaxID=2569761 RepID=UPI00113F1C49
MQYSLALSAVLSTGVTSLALAHPAPSAAAVEQACSADSPRLIETVPAVTHTESRFAKTVSIPAVGSPTLEVANPDYVPASSTVVQHPAVYETVVVEREFSHRGNAPEWKQADFSPNPASGWVATGNVRTEEREVTAAWQETVTVAAQGAETIEVPNPDYVPASSATVYYNGDPAGTADLAQAAWVRNAPAGWPQVVETRTIVDVPESYVCDFERPVTTLLNGSVLIRPGHVFALSSTDNHQVAKTVGNVYQGGSLLSSFQAKGDSLEVPARFADGTYTLRYNSQDVAGNIASTGSFTFAVDGTAPRVTDKGTDGAVAQSKSFKLFDA